MSFKIKIKDFQYMLKEEKSYLNGSITYHSSNVLVLLKILDNLGFVGGFDTGEASGTLAGDKLLVGSEVVEFAASVGLAVSLLVGVEDADFLADGDGSIL